MTQKSEILNYLKKNKSINQLVAFNEFRCFRLAPRILELRDEINYYYFIFNVISQYFCGESLFHKY